MPAELVLRWYGVGPGDEVIVPAYTYCATANIVAHVGAKPVLVDVLDDFTMDPAALRKAINHAPSASYPWTSVACLAISQRSCARLKRAIPISPPTVNLRVGWDQPTNAIGSCTGAQRCSPFVRCTHRRQAGRVASGHHRLQLPCGEEPDHGGRWGLGLQPARDLRHAGVCTPTSTP